MNHRQHVAHVRSGFSLVELLVVIAIIALLISILLPSLAKARRSANVVKCAANLRNIAAAFNAYLIDSHGTVFWRGESINDEGMDWYVYGGRPEGNLDPWQSGLFNRFNPRPLNPYVGNQLEVFHCPEDDERSWWTFGSSHFEWVGTSYNFNAIGDPQTTGNAAAGIGLVGKKFATAVRESSRTILFLDACQVYPGDWHGRTRGNICFADSHVSFLQRPTTVAGFDSSTGSLSFPDGVLPPSPDYTWGE